MGGRHRLYASSNRLNEFFHGATLPARRCHDGCNACQHVFNPVVELSDQQLLVFLGLAPLSEQRRKNICAEGADCDGNLGCQDTVADWKGGVAKLTDPERCGPNYRE